MTFHDIAAGQRELGKRIAETAREAARLIDDAGALERQGEAAFAARLEQINEAQAAEAERHAAALADLERQRDHAWGDFEAILTELAKRRQALSSGLAGAAPVHQLKLAAE